MHIKVFAMNDTYVHNGTMDHSCGKCGATIYKPMDAATQLYTHSYIHTYTNANIDIYILTYIYIYICFMCLCTHYVHNQPTRRTLKCRC